jgi:hypothetical protein
VQAPGSADLFPPTLSSSHSARRTLFERGSLQDLTKLHHSPYPPTRTAPLEFRQPTPNNLDPRDHSNLKACWDAMLTNRFLASQLVNVLPFYLSSLFSNVQSRPSLQVPLPQSSTVAESDGDSDSVSFASSCSWRDGGVDPEHSLRPVSGIYGGAERSAEPLRRMEPSWVCMHLAKSVRTVVACKAAMWTEWENLYGDTRALPPVTRTARPKEFPRDITRYAKTAARDQFEQAWCNWEK